MILYNIKRRVEHFQCVDQVLDIWETQVVHMLHVPSADACGTHNVDPTYKKITKYLDATKQCTSPALSDGGIQRSQCHQYQLIAQICQTWVNAGLTTICENTLISLLRVINWTISRRPGTRNIDQGVADWRSRSHHIMMHHSSTRY